MEKLVTEYGTSGLTRGAFCQQWELAVGTLDKCRRRVDKGHSQGGPLLPVDVVSSRSGSDGDHLLMVELRSGRRIEVRRGFDAGTLERLLIVLDGA